MHKTQKSPVIGSLQKPEASLKYHSESQTCPSTVAHAKGSLSASAEPDGARKKVWGAHPRLKFQELNCNNQKSVYVAHCRGWLSGVPKW